MRIIHISFLLSFFLIFSAYAEIKLESQTGLSMHGSPELEKDFSHYPYVRPDAPKGGTLALAQLNTFDSLNPYISIGAAPDAASRFVLQSLMTRSLDEPFTLYALVAKSYEMPENRTFITFNIDERARFSDGLPLTAKDVFFSFSLLKNKGKPFFRSSFQHVEKVTIEHTHRIRFDMQDSEDRELPLILATMPIFAAHATDAETFASPSLKPIIGSGPYRFGKIDPGNRVVLERNPLFWAKHLPVSQGLYNFDQITYDFYRESNALFEAFKSLHYDWRLETEPTRWVLGYNVKPVQQGLIIKKEFPVFVPQGMNGFVFNTRNPLFSDVRVRQALASLLDFQWINQNLYYGTQKRANSYFANSELSSAGRPADDLERRLLKPFMNEVQPDILEGIWHPPEPEHTLYTDRKIARKALDLLEKSGWVLMDGELRQSKTKVPFTFEIMVTTPEQERLALNYSSSLKRLGITAIVRRVDDVQFWRRLSTFDFDMMQRTWVGSPSPGNEQRNRWGTQAADQKSSLNYAGVRSSGVDSVIEALLTAKSREDFVSTVRALDRLLLSGHYVVPLFYTPNQWVAYNSKLEHPSRIPLLGAPVEIWWQKKTPQKNDKPIKDLNN